MNKIMTLEIESRDNGEHQVGVATSGVAVTLDGRNVKMLVELALKFRSIIEIVDHQRKSELDNVVKALNAAEKSGAIVSRKPKGSKARKLRITKPAGRVRGRMTAIKAMDIRSWILKHPKETYREIAERFGVSYTTVQRLVSGETYVEGCGMAENKSDRSHWLTRQGFMEWETKLRQSGRFGRILPEGI